MKIETSIPLQAQSKIKQPKESFYALDNKESMRGAQLMKKSNELEAVFLTQLIQSMEKTIPKSDGGGKNSLSTMMFGSVMGDAMTSGGGIGLSKMIFQSLKKMDESFESLDFPTAGGNDYMQTMNILQNIHTAELNNE